MEAGRELDALIAEKVMGWQGKKIIYRWSDRKKKTNPLIAFTEGVEGMGDYSTFVDDEGLKIQVGAPHRVFFAPNYSTDITDAWKVLEKLIQLGAEINVGFYKQWDCSIDYPIGCNWLVQAETAPLAICLAALKAVGHNLEVQHGSS